MISLTQLNGTPLYVNPNLIEIMESTPDTVLTLTNGKKLLVKESPDIVSRRFAEFFANVSRPMVKAREDLPWT